MAQLIVRYGSRPEEIFPVTRLRTTIGRSARSDVCIPDAFASRLHAEVRQEGDNFWLHDLGSANGTRLDGVPVTGSVPLASGSHIQIGETTLDFVADPPQKRAISATLVSDQTTGLDPSKTIALTARKNPTTEILDAGQSSRNDLLGLISKVGVTLLSSKGLDDTLDQIASLVFEAVPAERVVIMLRDVDGGQLVPRVARLRGKDEIIDEIRVSSMVMKEVIENGKSVLTSDAQHDPRYASQTIMLQGIRSVLAVPLSVDERHVFGLVYADSPVNEMQFTKEHLDLLTTLASVASIRVENASLMEERIKRERMARELELATEIQQRFQPSAPPKLDGYQTQGISFSCYEIGGDYYDFIQRDNGNLLFALGDVSGKGTAAALLMSSLHAALHAQANADRTIERSITAVNEYLADNTPSNRFVTLFLAELNPASGLVQYINAGHNPPLVGRRDGRVEQLGSGGLPLGIMSQAQYEPDEFILEQGDVLVVYSDGVSEANDLSENEFGLDRLTSVIKANLTSSAAGLRDKIESALSEFTGTAPANDDITLVIVKRL